MDERCLICKRVMDDPKDPIRTMNCGGDCLECMALIAEDPDCIATLKELDTTPTK